MDLPTEIEETFALLLCQHGLGAHSLQGRCTLTSHSYSLPVNSPATSHNVVRRSCQKDQNRIIMCWGTFRDAEIIINPNHHTKPKKRIFMFQTFLWSSCKIVLQENKTMLLRQFVVDFAILSVCEMQHIPSKQI